MPLTWLFDLMATWRDQTAIVWNDRSTSYGALLDLINAVGRFLDDQGVNRGEVVALRAEFSPTSIALLLALIERAAIVVPLAESALPHGKEFERVAEVQSVLRV